MISLEKEIGVPLHIQLQRTLREAIQKGRFSPGCMLPSSRVFASELGVSRGVVVDAYEQLVAEGYLCSRRGSSTYVAGRPPANSLSIIPDAQIERPPIYDLRPGRPDHSLFPRRQWLSATRRAIYAAPDGALDYPDARGALPARRALATYLNRSRATATTTEKIVLCNGFAQGMRLVCEALKAHGVRRIAVEDPGHAYESADVRASGLELVPVSVDECGFCVERLARLKVGAIYVTPAHQYPTGAVLSAERRKALLSWADEHAAFVVEDDYDGEYRYDREPIGALQGLEPERVIYIGTASKTLAPALRIGWVLSPQALIQDLSQAKVDADRGSPVIEQLALAEFIEGGHLDRHLRRTRLIYSRRRAQLAAALRRHLPECSIDGVAAGLHLILKLPEQADETSIVEEARRRGVYLHGLRIYRSRPQAGHPALLLGYARVTEKSIDDSASALAAVISSFQRSHRHSGARPS